MKNDNRPTEMDCSRYYGVKVLYDTFVKITGHFFTWALILIAVTGGKITVQIGLIDWAIKLLK